MAAPDYTAAVADLNDSRRVRASDATLRDLFAAHALTGMLAYTHDDLSAGQMTPRAAAREAFLFADAMLAARSQQPQAT